MLLDQPLNHPSKQQHDITLAAVSHQSSMNETLKLKISDDTSFKHHSVTKSSTL